MNLPRTDLEDHMIDLTVGFFALALAVALLRRIQGRQRRNRVECKRRASDTAWGPLSASGGFVGWANGEETGAVSRDGRKRPGPTGPRSLGLLCDWRSARAICVFCVNAQNTESGIHPENT
jgi:hypothetical protein